MLPLGGIGELIQVASATVGGEGHGDDGNDSPDLVLVVEDEWFIADDLAWHLETAGAIVLK